MATVIEIPPVCKAYRTETIMFPENDLYYLIAEYLGHEAAGIYDELITELEEYREKEKQNE